MLSKGFQFSEKPWPPPPDKASIRELVAAADTENFIATGSPLDEYDIEADKLFLSIAGWPSDELIPQKLLLAINSIWENAFESAHSTQASQARMEFLAAQIARFFGPGARPQVRGAGD